MSTIKNTNLLMYLLVASFALVLMVSEPAGAQTGGRANITCPDGSTHSVPRNLPEEDKRSFCDEAAQSQGGSPQNSGNFEADCKSDSLNKDNCGIISYLVTFTRILSGLVGIVIVIMITIGGIQYAAAGPDPGAVVAAKKRIINAILALALYVFMFAFLQWLVPGGIF